jgi:hypothetical protein
MLSCILPQMLPRYWAECPGERDRVPEQTADRILVFQRGVDVVRRSNRPLETCP